MTRNDTRKFTDAPTLAQPSPEHLRAMHAAPDDTYVPDDAAGEGDLDTDLRPPRPVSHARVGLSRKAHARQFNDPSNYLG